jgi:phage-related protein (TIGR01555 family)
MERNKMVTRVTNKSVDIQKKNERKTLKDKATGRKTVDSFANFQLQLGMGTDNQLSAGTYGFNPITRYRVLLEWIHRGSWLGGIAIDVAAEDMIRGGIEIHSTMSAKDIGKMQKGFVDLGIWDRLTFGVKMGRLYGGAIGVYLIDGHDLSTPLDISKVGKNQFKGLMVLDRWQCTPTLNQDGLVEEFGPDLGKPKYYVVNNDSPALRGKKIHYTRVIRFVGTELPYFQSILEQLWGLSILERLYDRLIAFDSSTSGIAQYIHRMHLRVIKVDGYRQIMAAGGKLFLGFQKFAEALRRYQSNEGITFIDAKDDFIAHNSNISSGISEALLQLGQQLAGALQMPLVRLFGQSPAGLNATGESDLRTYYESILQKQEQTLRIPVTKLCYLVGHTNAIKIPEEFGFNFRSLWALTDEQKSGVFDRDTRAIVEAFETNIISQKIALQELRQLGRYTNRWTNISDKDIEEAEDEVMKGLPGEMPGMNAQSGKLGQGEQKPDQLKSIRQFNERGSHKAIPVHHNTAPRPKDNAIDRAIRSVRRIAKVVRDETPIMTLFGLPIVIECKQGEKRWENGPDWPSDYGYIASAIGTDGDELDCFIGADYTSDKVFIVNHNDEDGDFEELKVMLGFNSVDEVLDVYEKGYNRKSEFPILEISLKEINSWLAHADPTKQITGRSRKRDQKNQNGLDDAPVM